MVKVFVKVLARRLRRFTVDRILTEAQEGFRVVGDVWDQRLLLRGVCEVRKRKKMHTWPFWILVRVLTVSGERDCGIRWGNME